MELKGKTEEDLNEDENYNLVINIIKSMILNKVNGGLIYKWFKGINKCLFIV